MKYYILHYDSRWELNNYLLYELKTPTSMVEIRTVYPDGIVKDYIFRAYEVTGDQLTFAKLKYTIYNYYTDETILRVIFDEI